MAPKIFHGPVSPEEYIKELMRMDQLHNHPLKKRATGEEARPDHSGDPNKAVPYLKALGVSDEEVADLEKEGDNFHVRHTRGRKYRAG